jgi:hypothetical protein
MDELLNPWVYPCCPHCTRCCAVIFALKLGFYPPVPCPFARSLVYDPTIHEHDHLPWRFVESGDE